MNQLEQWLEVYFGQKAPRLPDGFREFLVKVAPWLTLLGIIVSLPLVLGALGLGTMFGPWMMAGVYGWGNVYFWLLVSLVIMVLEIIALPGLFHRARKGWLFAFYAVLVRGAQQLLMGNIVGLIIGLLISFYLLFQVRSYYH